VRSVSRICAFVYSICHVYYR